MRRAKVAGFRVLRRARRTGTHSCTRVHARAHAHMRTGARPGKFTHTHTVANASATGNEAARARTRDLGSGAACRLAVFRAGQPCGASASHLPFHLQRPASSVSSPRSVPRLHAGRHHPAHYPYGCALQPRCNCRRHRHHQLLCSAPTLATAPAPARRTPRAPPPTVPPRPLILLRCGPVVGFRVGRCCRLRSGQGSGRRGRRCGRGCYRWRISFRGNRGGAGGGMVKGRSGGLHGVRHGSLRPCLAGAFHQLRYYDGRLRGRRRFRRGAGRAVGTAQHAGAGCVCNIDFNRNNAADTIPTTFPTTFPHPLLRWPPCWLFSLALPSGVFSPPGASSPQHLRRRRPFKEPPPPWFDRSVSSLARCSRCCSCSPLYAVYLVEFDLTPAPAYHFAFMILIFPLSFHSLLSHLPTPRSLNLFTSPSKVSSYLDFSSAMSTNRQTRMKTAMLL